MVRVHAETKESSDGRLELRDGDNHKSVQELEKDQVELHSSEQNLAYCMAIVLRLNNLKDSALPRRLIRALLSANLQVAILKSSATSSDKVVILVDATTNLCDNPRAGTEAVCSDIGVVLSQSQASQEAKVKARNKVLFREQARLKGEQVCLNLTSDHIKDHAQEVMQNLTPAEELVLIYRIIQRALDEINIDTKGAMCMFDTICGGERSTPLEQIVDDIFPLQDEVWNESFLRTLRFPRTSPSQSRLEKYRIFLMHIWEKWIVQRGDNIHAEGLRIQFGDRIFTCVEFMLFYRTGVIGLMVACTLHYFLVRFALWSMFIIDLGVIGILTCCVWAPLLARRWSIKYMHLAKFWKSRHVLVPLKSVENPHVPSNYRSLSQVQRHRRRTIVSLITVVFVVLNIVLLVPVSLFFTQWYVYGKHAPTCECCDFLLYKTGIGNGTQNMEDVPRELWPQACYEEYFIHREAYPLMYSVQPSNCGYWSVCFSQSAATVGTDRWVYILCQGIVMGLILDVFQTYAFRKLMFRLTRFEAHATLENFQKFYVRKSFFFIWLNMFVWYLSITFLYVPFGAAIQTWLVDAGFGVIVPPWGWRADKIRLDEAFVTPVIVTSFVNGFLDLFVPMHIAKLAMKAKRARRKLQALRISRGGFSSQTLINTAAWQTNKQPESATEGVPIQSEEMGRSEALYQEMQANLCDAPHVLKNLRFFSNTPDRNSYNAEEVLLQSLLPKYAEDDDYLNIVVQLGYLCMFTSAWGLLPLAASCRLVFSYRGICYRLMYASKRTIPMGALESPGEWFSAFYVTILLAIPVICAQIGLSTGALDIVARLVTDNSACASAIVDDDLMLPDWKNCSELSLSTRVLVSVLLEHICICIFAYTYLSTNTHRGGNTLLQDNANERPVKRSSINQRIEVSRDRLTANPAGETSSIALDEVHLQMREKMKGSSESVMEDAFFSLCRILQGPDKIFNEKTFTVSSLELKEGFESLSRNPIVGHYFK